MEPLSPPGGQGGPWSLSGGPASPPPVHYNLEVSTSTPLPNGPPPPGYLEAPALVWP